eukprot:1423496-Lingulodinium_polyedra.AAC.1
MAVREICGPTAVTKKESVYDIAEIFSPPRTAARARRRGMRGGWSLDVAVADEITGRSWDLATEVDIKA